MEKLYKILEETRADIDFRNLTDKLIDDGILDSFDIITIVGEINSEFDIDVSVEDLLPENFNSPQAMMAMIQRLQEEG